MYSGPEIEQQLRAAIGRALAFALATGSAIGAAVVWLGTNVPAMSSNGLRSTLEHACAEARCSASPRAVQLNAVTTVGSPAAIDDLATRGADLACRAFSVQGDKAFAFTCRAAAHQEAGHAVINALDGIATDVLQGQAQAVSHTGTLGWIGFTEADAPWSVTPDRMPKDDSLQMRRMLAGWAAEILLEGDDLALGSSIDEALIAGNIAAWIADKTGREPDRVFQAVMVCVLADLALHESPVRGIAGLLMRERIVRGPRLQELLPPPCSDHPIKRPYPEPLVSRMNATMVAIAARMNAGKEGATK